MSRIQWSAAGLALLINGGTGCAVSDMTIEMANDASAGGSAVKVTSDGTCGNTCTTSQSCFSGQCCTPPLAGGVCNHFPACGCAADQVCRQNNSLHEMSCFGTDNIAEGADCANLVCAAGLDCVENVCAPYCITDSDCSAAPGAQKCEQIDWLDGTPIPGVSVCARICDPVHPQNPKSPLQSCPASFRCDPLNNAPGATVCSPAGTATMGSSCTIDTDCIAGLFCAANSCRAYCFTDSDCNGGTCSFGFSPAVIAGTYTVGYCT